MSAYFSLKSRPENWDVIVVGSGMGGMTAAAMLAKFGKKVLVLEQHYVPGGFTHEFKRDHWTWDVGVHAIGQVTERSLIGRVLHSLTGGKLTWSSLGHVYEQFFFPDDFRLDFLDDPQAFTCSLKEAFPADAPAIDAYYQQVKATVEGMRTYFLSRILPPFLGRLFDRFTPTPYGLTRTTAEVVAALTSDSRLQTVLTAHWGYYGATPSESAFAIHALVGRHYAYGAFYPVGGSARIAAGLLATVAEAGGWTRVRAPVAKVLLEGGRTKGVVLSNGEIINAPQVISSIGARETITRLIQTDLGTIARAKAWAQEITALVPSPCHLCVYLGFEGDIRQAGASGANQWFWDKWSSKEQAWDFSDGASAPPVLYTSYPSLKDPNHQGHFHTGEVVTFVSHGDFEQWRNLKTQHRGADYNRLKAELTERMLTQLFHFMPDLAPMLKYAELSTPLSTEHYTRSFKGAIYGLKPTPARFASSWLRPRTPIKGLYLAGCDVGTAGVVGAMIGGVLAVASMEPRKALRFLGANAKPSQLPP